MIEPRPACRTCYVNPTDHLLLERKLSSHEINLRTLRQPVPPVIVHSFTQRTHLTAKQFTAEIIVHRHRSGHALPARAGFISDQSSMTSGAHVAGPTQYSGASVNRTCETESIDENYQP